LPRRICGARIKTYDGQAQPISVNNGFPARESS
jgi:hypothetical protein